MTGMTDICPCCTASLTRSAPHCDSPTCVWLVCGKCRARLCIDDGTYFTQTLWGNDKGYLKAAD